MHKMHLKVTKLVYYLNFAFMNIKTHFGFFSAQFKLRIYQVLVCFAQVPDSKTKSQIGTKYRQNWGNFGKMLYFASVSDLSQDLLIFFHFSQEFFTHMEASQISIKGCKFWFNYACVWHSMSMSCKPSRHYTICSYIHLRDWLNLLLAIIHTKLCS